MDDGRRYGVRFFEETLFSSLLFLFLGTEIIRPWPAAGGLETIQGLVETN